MVKKEEPDEETANGSRYNSSYYTKPEHGEDFNENGQTDNYDEWVKKYLVLIIHFFYFAFKVTNITFLLVYLYLAVYIYKNILKSNRIAFVFCC